MPINILMPALSPTMEKGNLSRWLKKEGDKVKSGDMLAEIETDKATMEVEAVDEGVLAKIVVPDGTADVPVNDVIGVIAGEGEDANQRAARPPACRAALRACSVSSAAAAGSSDPGRFRAMAPPSTATPGRAFSPRRSRGASPRIEGLDLAAIAGCGPHGRIVERDVKAALTQPRPQTAQAPAPPRRPRAAVSAPASDEAIRKFFEPGSFEETPHDSMRKTIARRLVEASQTIPHFYLSVDCDLDALLALREQVNAAAPRDKDGKPAYKISVNDFIIKALALALMRVPDANVTWTEAAMLKHKHADVGVAVSIPGGLITPVVRSAEIKTLSVISNEMKDFARAREGAQAEARGISGRLVVGLQSRHDRDQEFLRHHQPAAGVDPRGRRGRAARHREGRRAGGRDDDERDALDRSSRHRRRARRRAARRFQISDRKRPSAMLV